MSSFDFADLQNSFEKEIAQVGDVFSLEELRVKYLGKKSLVALALSSLKSLSDEERPLVGKLANELKNKISALIENKKSELQDNAFEVCQLDISLPSIKLPLGTEHPVTIVMKEICGIFVKMGFTIMEGPEIESEDNNFTGLNIPLDHPSREAFDTFYLKGDELEAGSSKLKDKKEKKRLLRSHTSPVQVRVMKENRPPLAIVVPGKVYRPDAVDASHLFMFNQVEGLLVDKNVKFSDLKGALTHFAKELFGSEIKMRFRPHFFPFTEPSVEVDVSCIICKGKGCSVCGHKGWLEILGAGLVHPAVFKYVGYKDKEFTGFAFGMGVERIAILKYGINDIRLFFENDLRFLKQF